MPDGNKYSRKWLPARTLLAGDLNVQGLATKCDEIFRKLEKIYLLTAVLPDNDITASILCNYISFNVVLITLTGYNVENCALLGCYSRE